MTAIDDDEALLDEIITRSNRLLGRNTELGHRTSSKGTTMRLAASPNTCSLDGETPCSPHGKVSGGIVSTNLQSVDEVRKRISGRTSSEKKAALGQYMTPAPVAKFMAAMFPKIDKGGVKLLDAGAGVGSLTSAFLDCLMSKRETTAHVTAYEIDSGVLPSLKETLSAYGQRGRVTHSIAATDFIQQAVLDHCTGNGDRYTHAILNPPYMKIASQSPHRHLLRRIGLETVNLYSGFMATSLLLSESGGFLCAITPRSFCNGPYYRPFREFMMRRASLRRIHLFDSRKRAFADDGVLQENVITLWQRDGLQSDVEVSRSSDASFGDISSFSLAFDNVVRKGDKEKVVHIPTDGATQGRLPDAFCHTLESLGIDLSTGPVVDFRLRDFLLKDSHPSAVPLLYPCHFDSGRIEWPKNGKKPNAIVRSDQTERWLYPRGNYALVRRFSSKEEKRRVVAAFLSETDHSENMIGLENHLNVFHRARAGLEREVARGLVVYLNSTMLDNHFRVFNGHTQVNATDLRNVPYPNLKSLIQMGKWADQHNRPTQEAIDKEVSRHT